MSPLPLSYYRQSDTLFLSRDLLGKFLFTQIGKEEITGGMITETEAYCAPEDRASHAYGNRKTERNKLMFSAGGVSYVYRCYGIHCLLNIVTHRQDIPHAILIRAIYPTAGLSTMLRRRGKEKADRTLAGGPGTLAKALGIDMIHNGTSLLGPEIWLEDRGVAIPEEAVIIGPRVGIDYAGEDASLPWRFRVSPKFLKEKDRL